MYESAIWHPCSQMKDYETFKPLDVETCQGSYLYLKNGKPIIDAISSWWCKSLGHNHRKIKTALIEQINKIEHVILANTTNDTISTLSNRLSHLKPWLNHVLYASDGSCAVECALKMSLHARKIKGDNHRSLYISLQNAYHGETVGALSVSDLGIYKTAYQDLLFESHFINDLPYVSGEDDPLWHDASTAWEQVEAILQPLADKATAIIIEPILQAAGGMKIYSQDFLRRLGVWAKINNIHIIADEIMTGFGRVGKMFAFDYADIEPDFVCLAKGLTAGYLPMSATLTTREMYHTFYQDYEKGHNFLHSHTHSGNTLAAKVAITVLDILADDKIIASANNLGQYMSKKMHDIAGDKLTNIRQIGAVIAADLVTDKQRFGYQVYKKRLTSVPY